MPRKLTDEEIDSSDDVFIHCGLRVGFSERHDCLGEKAML